MASYGPLLCIISCTFVDVTENGLAEKQLYVKLQSNIVSQVFIHLIFRRFGSGSQIIPRFEPSGL